MKTAPDGLHTQESVEKRILTRKNQGERIKKYGFLAPLKAIRAHCLDCQGEGPSWVTNCDQYECPLWPYRMARRPKEKDLRVAQISRVGEVTGYKTLDDVRAEES